MQQKKPTPPTMEEVLTEYEKLLIDYNNLVKVCNARIDDCKAFLTFLTLQCGILNTAITGQMPVDPVAHISILTLNNQNEDLSYMHRGLVTFVKAIQEGKSVNEALTVWQEFIEK